MMKFGSGAGEDHFAKVKIFFDHRIAHFLQERLRVRQATSFVATMIRPRPQKERRILSREPRGAEDTPYVRKCHGASFFQEFAAPDVHQSSSGAGT